MFWVLSIFWVWVELSLTWLIFWPRLVWFLIDDFLQGVNFFVGIVDVLWGVGWGSSWQSGILGRGWFHRVQLCEMATMSNLTDIEKDFVQWMVMGPDYDFLRSFGDEFDLDVEDPRKGDGFEVSLSYCYADCKFLVSLAFLRSKLKYWCDVTRANKLIITSSSLEGWDINELTVYLDQEMHYLKI